MPSREETLTLIVQQLQFYQLNSLASVISQATGISSTNEPSDKLVQMLTQAEEMGIPDTQNQNEGGQSVGHQVVEDLELRDCLRVGSFQSEKPAEVPSFALGFTTAHKDICLSSVFSVDGMYAATCSKDTSLKVLDVEKMKMKDAEAEKPMIRALYDHVEAVNTVAFHPNGRVLASGSDDYTIKLYDLQRVGVKRAFRYLQDTEPIKSIAFHPSGDYLLASTPDSVIRIFDVKNLKCYTSSENNENVNHSSGINSVKYSTYGNMYVSGGEDGHIKIWDGQNGKLIRTIENAHGNGKQIYSASFSKSSNYLLSSGGDHIHKLWDVSSGECILEYKSNNSKRAKAPAVFNYNEDYILTSDDKNIFIYCSRTAKVLTKIVSTGVVVSLATSPTEDCFISSGMDFRARFWKEQQ
jgi:cleavage stimulation factor subunit 1